jgi:hypothetical protein
MQRCYSKLSHNIKTFEAAHPLFAGTRPRSLDDRFVSQFVAYQQGAGKASKTVNDLVWYLEKLGERFAHCLLS